MVGLDPTADGAEGPGGRLIDANRVIEEVGGTVGGYTYRAPLS